MILRAILLFVVLCQVLHVSGCVGASHHAATQQDMVPDAALPPTPNVGDQAPYVITRTTRGVRVLYPVWVDRHPEMLVAALLEIDTVAPEMDYRISSEYRGVPLTATVTILDPGPYYAPYSPTGLALGEWHTPHEIFVAWRGAQVGVLLPALPHELRHPLTQDAGAGH